MVETLVFSPMISLAFHFFPTCDSVQALDSAALVRGGVVTEGSAGSTAISLATVAPAYGCKCHVVIPDDAAIEKVYAQLHLFFLMYSC